MAAIDDDELDPAQMDTTTPVDAPVAPSTSPQNLDALRSQLYGNLQNRLAGKDNMASDRKDVDDQSRRNALLVALNQSANQAGTLGGKSVSSAPVAGVAADLEQSDRADLTANADVQAKRDKVQDYLLGQLQKSDQVKSQMAASAQSRADSLAQAAKLNEQNNQNKKDIANIVASTKQNINDSNNDAGRYGGGAKADQKVDERFTKFGHDLNSGLASSRSDMGKQQGTVSAADKVLTLGQQGDSQQGGLDNRQIHELALASASLVSGGGTGAAQSTVEALVPHSAGSIESRVEEWLTSNPTGANQQQFVHRMLDTAQREKQLAGEKIKGYKAEVLDSYSDLAGKDPDRYNRVKARVFGDDSQFDKNGSYVQQQYKPPEAPAAPPAPGTAMAGTTPPKTDPKITTYATQHGLDYGTASALLQGRGYKPNEQ